MRRSTRSTLAVLLCLTLLVPACWAMAGEPQAKEESILLVVYDAGETFGLLPVTRLLAEHGVGVAWIPLTPWAARILDQNGQTHFALPPESERGYLADRDSAATIDHWTDEIATRRPDIVVVGLVSRVQQQLAEQCRARRLPTVGYYDAFDPPASRNSITVRVAAVVDAVWVPTDKIRREFVRFGFDVVKVVGQPSVESWARLAREADGAGIRQHQGLRADEKVLLYAGQYGRGYEPVLRSFARQADAAAQRDPALVVVFSPHPRTDGSLERSVLEEIHNERLVMMNSAMSTAEFAPVADVVATWTSTVGVQAKFMGKSVFYYSLQQDGYTNNLVECGLARLATPQTFAAILSELLQEAANPESVRRKLVEMGYVVDSDQRITGEILELLGRPQ